MKTDLKTFEALEKENAELEREVITLRETSSRLEEKVESLTEKLDYFLKRIYGRRSERFEHPGQLDFFPETLDPSKDSSGEPEPDETGNKKRRTTKRHGPTPLPEHLPRDIVPWEPDEGERECMCCKESMERVDETVFEELTVKPPEFRVTQYVRGKWRCKGCMSSSISKPLPARPIEKGRPSPSLLAYLVVSKWTDHLPLYRQEQIFKRYGFELKRQTMNEWLGRLSDLLRPIVESMKRSLVARRFLQSDDTPIRYLDKEVKGKSQRGYLWAYGIPRGEIVYQFATSRSHMQPIVFLEGFSGHLQTDGFAAYNALYKTGRVEHIACMAHIRRKFEDSLKSSPKRVGEILTLIQRLYDLERSTKDDQIRGEQLVNLRREKALPLLAKLKSKIEAIAALGVPKGKLGKAVKYARGQWESMLRYVDVAEAKLDNNWCENAMRPIVLGRKNFLFLGSEKSGGERAEVFFSLVQSCRRLDVDPFAYLSDVIARISTHPQSRVGELTPRGWRDAQASAEKLNA